MLALSVKAPPSGRFAVGAAGVARGRLTAGGAPSAGDGSGATALSGSPVPGAKAPGWPPAGLAGLGGLSGGGDSFGGVTGATGGGGELGARADPPGVLIAP